MGKKLPRRTVSMSKRMSGQAKAPTLGVKSTKAEQEEAEQLEERAQEVEAEQEAAAGAGYIGAWAVAMLSLIVAVAAVRLIFAFPLGGGESDFAPAGALSRVAEEQPANTQQGAPSSALRGSPFPEARGETPIIVDVDCPHGTLEIATGPRSADTVCIRGQLVEPEPIEEPTTTPTEGPTTTRIIVVTEPSTTPSE